MSTTSSVKRWYPNLKGIANPKSAFEVQTAEAMHQLTDYVYSVNDRIPAPAAPAKAEPAASANWWTQPYAADQFSADGTGSAITISWSSYKISPTLYAKRKTQYLQPPPGSVTASGLTGSSNYWFYPAYDTRSGKIVFAVDVALAVANSVAHTAPSTVAMMRAASGGNVPLSTNGIGVSRSAGALAGLGGGLIHGVNAG